MMSRLDEVEEHCRSSLSAGPDAKSEDTLWLVARVKGLEAVAAAARAVDDSVEDWHEVTWNEDFTKVCEALRRALAAGEAE